MLRDLALLCLTVWALVVGQRTLAYAAVLLLLRDKCEPPVNFSGRSTYFYSYFTFTASPGARQVLLFPDLFAQIDAAIAALGGQVLPKLNWSAPLDAAWLTTSGSIACTNAEEVGLRMLG